MQTYNQFTISRGLMKEAPYGLNKLGKQIIHMSGASKENNYYDLDESQILDVIFTESQRHSKRRNLVIWASVTGTLFLYISFLLIFFWK